jgi:uncharacterized membrane protein (UPF0136 family)
VASTKQSGAPALRAPEFYTRLIVAGFLLIALNGLIILIAGAAAGQLGDVSFNGVYVLTAMIAAAISWRFRTWALALGILLGLVLLLSVAPRALSSGDWIPLFLYVVGGLVVLLAAIVGLADRIRRRT